MDYLRLLSFIYLSLVHTESELYTGIDLYRLALWNIWCILNLLGSSGAVEGSVTSSLCHSRCSTCRVQGSQQVPVGKVGGREGGSQTTSASSGADWIF